MEKKKVILTKTHVQLNNTLSAVCVCVCVTDRYTMRHEDVGVHDGDQLVQEVRLILKQLWGQFMHHLLQPFRCHRGNSVPGLGFTPVLTIDEEVKI